MDTLNESPSDTTAKRVDPLARAFVRANKVAEGKDRDAYQYVAQELASLIPNYLSHTVETSESGYYIDVRLYFPDKKHR